MGVPLPLAHFRIREGFQILLRQLLSEERLTPTGATSIIAGMPPVVAVVLSLALIWGCTSTPVQNAADLGEVEALRGALHELTVAYERGDAQALSSYLAPTFKEVDQFRQKIDADIKSYPGRHLSLAAQRIWIRENEATVTLRWDGNWTPTPPQPSVRLTGTADFLFIKEKGGRFQLGEIQGENPFGRQL